MMRISRGGKIFDDFEGQKEPVCPGARSQLSFKEFGFYSKNSENPLESKQQNIHHLIYVLKYKTQKQNIKHFGVGRGCGKNGSQPC